MSDKTFELVKQTILEWPIELRERLANDLATEWGVNGAWSLWDLHLTHDGGRKIQCIKIIREITGLGLKESKELVDDIPSVIKTKLTRAQAEEFRRKFETEAEASVEIKCSGGVCAV